MLTRGLAAVLREETGGAFAQTNVLYADVTGDGVEEAVVPLASNGTLGYVAFAVLSPDGKGGASAILTAKPEEAGGFNVAVGGGQGFGGGGGRGAGGPP